MKELIKNALLMPVIFTIIILAIVKNDTTIAKPDTTIKKYIDEEANMMCYYTDTWGSCFYVLED